MSRYWSLIMYVLCLFSSWQLLRLEWLTTFWDPAMDLFGNMIHVHYHGWFIHVTILFWPQYLIHLTVINLEFMGYPSYNLWNADQNNTKLAYNTHILYKSSSWGTHSWVTEQFAIISKSKLNYCIILNCGDDFFNVFLKMFRSRCYRVMIMA